jgi:hypothetical protein
MSRRRMIPTTARTTVERFVPIARGSARFALLRGPGINPDVPLTRGMNSHAPLFSFDPYSDRVANASMLHEK